ncbi:MAG: SDR family oxidoreductase [Pseudomonadota bacterium]
MTQLPPTLITGAATRIGKTLALGLAVEGTPIVVHYNHSRDAAQAVVSEIRQKGGQAVAIGANLLDGAHVPTLVKDAAEALGQPLGCLINNASLFEKDEAGSLTADLFAQHFAIHATAPALLTDALAAQLKPEIQGLVVNIIDQRVWRLTPNFTSYTASKFALWGLTQTQAQAYAPRLRVNAIGPGPTLANERQNASDFQKQTDAVPLGTGPDLSAFAETIQYLWQMKSMTGQMIALDGGQHLAWETPDVAGINE